MKTFKNAKSRNADLEMIITLKPADLDLIRFYCLDLNYNIQTTIKNALKNKLGNNLNYYISEYTIKDNQGFFGHYKVAKIEKINLEVNNPLE